MITITLKQKQIGEYILNYRATKIKSPTIGDISKHFKVVRGTIWNHLKRMEEKGYIQNMKPTRKLISLIN